MKTKLFGSLHQRGIDFVQRFRSDDLVFQFDDLGKLVQEPGIDTRQFKDLFHAHATLDRISQVPNASVVRSRKFLADRIFIGAFVGVPQVFVITAESEAANFQTTERLLKGLLERTADGHCFTDTLHLSHQGRVGFREFFKSKTRDLGDDVIDRRFEAGFGLASNIVWQFPKPIADSQFGSDFGDRESSSLGGQRTGATDSRIHLDHNQAIGIGVAGKLNVRAAGLDTDFADHGQTCIAHPLVLFVRERLRRGDGNRIAGVYAHRVKVLDATNDHDVVVHVAHHLHLELFPADDGFFYQDLSRR